MATLTEEQLLDLERETRWRPLPGPQTLAFHSQADVLLYGGAAGGGKTDLALGLASTQHRRSVIFRRVYPSLQGIVERGNELFRFAARFRSSSPPEWRFHDGRVIRLGHLQHAKNVTDWQGQPHDLYVFDELPEFIEAMFRFVIGWNRTTIPGQRCRVVATANPPTDADGEWTIGYFAPWLDPNHRRPALPGELRFFTTIDGEDVEVESAEPLRVGGQLVVPRSRTFIPARLADNPILAATGYGSQLAALPEPLRSKLLFGDFSAGREDDAFQIIPSAWVQAAQARWKPRAEPGPMHALGVDVARGGRDKTILAPRHANWFAPLQAHPGSSTPDGPLVATLVITAVGQHLAKAQVDIIGVGSSAYDSLRPVLKDRAVPMNASESSEKTDKSGQLGFVNRRAEWWWGMREALDPASGQDIELPPDNELRADLCAPRWKLTARGIQVEGKDEIKKRIGRSTDRGDAVVLANAIKHLPNQGLLDYAREQMAERAAAAKAAPNAAPTQQEKKPWTK